MRKTGLCLAAAIPLVGLLVLAMFSLNATAADKDRIQVVTSLPLVKNIVERVGGTRVTVKSIIQGSACDHAYEPSANDLKNLADCDVFVKIGLGSDPWADKLAQGILTKQTLFVDPAKGIKPLKVNDLENPHYWGSPDNVKIMAQNILAGLCAVRPAQKGYFTANWEKYRGEIEQTAAELKAKARKVAGKPFVSYVNAFPYFFRYFGFQNLMTVEISHEQEVSPKDLARAVKLIKAKRISVLVGEATEPEEPEGLARETGAKIALLWAATDASGDYLKTLRRNVETLVTALQ